ncbi:MAG: pseudouridine synthase [Ramlibacter sp.]|jgi:tRNA pseudouridine32 synthase/23S rRNA pseudouridine746 synthase|nr:pseudouridine synthase [Ramlibacter sp.]
MESIGDSSLPELSREPELIDDALVLHADDHLLVLNKPTGLLCVPGRGADKQDCLSARVRRLYPDALVVHRLDMATSGLCLMARSAPVQRLLGDAFAQRQIGKRYVAVVEGLPAAATDPEEWAVIDLPIAADWPNRPLRVIDVERGKPSQTRWRVLSHDTVANTTRVELEPLTGRSHQLRLHLRSLGHPILGDAWYAPPEVHARSGRLLLHASELRFAHPATGQALTFASAVPF